MQPVASSSTYALVSADHAIELSGRHAGSGASSAAGQMKEEVQDQLALTIPPFVATQNPPINSCKRYWKACARVIASLVAFSGVFAVASQAEHLPFLTYPAMEVAFVSTFALCPCIRYDNWDAISRVALALLYAATFGVGAATVHTLSNSHSHNDSSQKNNFANIFEPTMLLIGMTGVFILASERRNDCVYYCNNEE